MILFRPAQPTDAGLISHIFASSWRKSYKGLIEQDYLDRLPDDYWVPSVRSWFESGVMEGLMVYEDKEPVGCAIYGSSREENHRGWGELVSIYIKPECLRAGYGSALIQQVLSQLRQEGYTRYFLWMIDGNRTADAFYRKHGFKPTGDHVDYHIGGTPVRDVRYVLVEQ